MQDLFVCIFYYTKLYKASYIFIYKNEVVTSGDCWTLIDSIVDNCPFLAECFIDY